MILLGVDAGIAATPGASHLTVVTVEKRFDDGVEPLGDDMKPRLANDRATLSGEPITSGRELHADMATKFASRAVRMSSHKPVSR